MKRTVEEWVKFAYDVEQERRKSSAPYGPRFAVAYLCEVVRNEALTEAAEKINKRRLDEHNECDDCSPGLAHARELVLDMLGEVE